MRKRVVMDFEEFDTQANGWFESFADPLPQILSLEELQKNKSFGIKDVVKYVETTVAISGRLGSFECYAGTSDFYRLVAKPLLSMGTVGSMDCERRAKPLKNTILTKNRNRMWIQLVLHFFEDTRTFIISCMRRRCLERGLQTPLTLN